MLNVKSLLRRKKKRQVDKKKELFLSILNSLDQITTRQNLMYSELQLDFGKYDEAFLEIIDALILLHFEKEGAELISWYLWERVNPDGSMNYLLDEDDNAFTVETPDDLWALLLAVNKSLNG